MRKWFFWGLCALCPLPSFGHLGPKDVRSIEHPQNRGGERWVVIDNLGLFLFKDDSVQWVCDEGLTPLPGLNASAPMDALGSTWLIGTRSGLRRSTDAGCSFLPPSAPLDTHVIAQISTHPDRPNEALVSTQTLGSPNDLFLTEDAGATWSKAGLDIRGRVRRFLRAPSDPQRIYLVHAGGALSSRDGGRTFAAFNLGPPELMATGTDIDLLAVNPDQPEELYAAYATFPDSTLIRSSDGGETWTSLITLPDVPDSLAVSSDGREIVFSTPVIGLYRSLDAGTSWEGLERQLESGTISCLQLVQGGQLLGCARRSEEALLVSSDDLGTSWRPLLSPSLDGVTRRDTCPADSETVEQCNYTCDDFPATCRQIDVDPPQDSESASPSSDAGLPMDRKETAGSGCSAMASPSEVGLLWAMLLIAALYRRRCGLLG